VDAVVFKLYSSKCGCVSDVVGDIYEYCLMFCPLLYQKLNDIPHRGHLETKRN
jgi:hypothetical protein